MAASRAAAQAAVDPNNVERDPRVALLRRTVVRADLCDEDQKQIFEIAINAYEKFVLFPTRSTWRKDEGARKELEREVERTSMRDLALSIKQQIDQQLGPVWHVVYGRSFATYVTYERMHFLHFTLDGADIVVWKHGA